MSFATMEPFYEYSTKGLRNPEGFKQQVDRAVREIIEVIGSDADVQVHVEPEAKDKGLYTLSISADVLGRPVTVKKTGKRVYTLLKQAKKTLIRLFRRSFVRKIKVKRHSVYVAGAPYFGEAS